MPRKVSQVRYCPLQGGEYAWPLYASPIGVIGLRAMSKQTIVAALVFCALARLPAYGQLAAPNESGVSIGHIHLLVKDPEAQKKIWVDALGAQVTRTGTLELLRLPGIFVVLTKGEPAAGSDGSTVNHFAFQVKDLAAI